MAAAADPNIDQLHKLAEEYFDAEAESQRRRLILDAHIQQMKRDGYSYPVLARESGLAQGTIQNIVAKSS